ncbi:STAS/SEC14 domain-containing protein [Pseudarthrobacter sp. NamE5]|uniref:DUF7793 family protein n=1 Tax=Pseudarthrobacter sp. NamE5 TaxID=2576839 RepID=UPI00110A50A2|nr:STAS/SEC14 domain-containing protein [Pseudarthrobacter sp. NamE5]TLM88203.1 STAS/SEC14 domain-containing protein [Pseudarthrobacter sp. NamE5]
MEDQGHNGTTGTLKLSGQILHLKWEPGSVVRESDARALMQRARALSAGQTLPLLVEMTGMTWIDQRAQEAFAAPWPLLRAAIVGSSPVDETIANFYTARHQPGHPTRFFTNLHEAMAWLVKDPSLP